ncbi:MAG: GtrA family protein [Clostridia bacterium]|nr:GtrA family protein [Clostridia bacterium]
MFNKLCKLYHTYKEAIDYLFWGGMTTVVSWGSYSLFVLLLQGLDSVVFWANVLSWVCAVLFAFITNKLWVFQSKSWAANILFPELTKFLSSRVATGIFEMIAVPALVAIGLNQTILGIDGMVSKILVSVVVVILNYILSKLFVFKNK